MGQCGGEPGAVPAPAGEGLTRRSHDDDTFPGTRHHHAVTGGVLLAAVFGLAPELLVGMLQKETERLQIEMKSSELQGKS